MWILGLGQIGVWQLVVLLFVVLLLFSRKLPKLARSMGSSIIEFKKGLKGGTERSSAEGLSASIASREEARNASEVTPAET